jgi:hypothetical protein
MSDLPRWYALEAERLQADIERLRSALELIAAPMRPDGTWNRCREACRQLAAESLRATVQPEATP